MAARFFIELGGVHPRSKIANTFEWTIFVTLRNYIFLNKTFTHIFASHPLDKYDDYFEEQTHSYELVKAENDGKIVTLGGIITNVRTIMTKSNTRTFWRFAP